MKPDSANGQQRRRGVIRTAVGLALVALVIYGVFILSGVIGRGA